MYRVEVTRQVPMDGKLLLDEKLGLTLNLRCAFASAVREYRHSFPDYGVDVFYFTRVTIQNPFRIR